MKIDYLQNEEINKIKSECGIYVFWRIDEHSIRYAYIGQSVNCYQRVIQHCTSFNQYIDLSIHKHGLYSPTNDCGYHIEILSYCLPDQLDELEMYYCLKYARDGYQMRNQTSGSQGKGKFSLDVEKKSNKGYREGVKDGQSKLKKEINQLLNKGLSIQIQDKITKNKEKALLKLLNLISLDNSTKN